MKKIGSLLCYLLPLLTTLPHCARKEADLPSTPAPLPTLLPPLIAKDSEGWETHEQVSQNGAVRLTRTDMPEKDRERVRNEYRQTTLTAIPVESSFNASIFKIKNVEEWSRTLFIAPRLYAYSSAEGGRIAPQRHSDGTFSLSFPIVLTDGTNGVIPSPNGGADITLPQAFLIHDLAGLRSALPATLAPLPGCPSKVLLKVNDQEIDVSPSDLHSGDYCQLNKPFIVTARLPESEARYVLEDALYTGAVEVRAVFETRASFVDSRATVSFDKTKLFRALEAGAQAHIGPWMEMEAQAHVSQAVKNEALDISIEGDSSPALESVIDQAVKSFFMPYRPDPATGLNPCTETIACLQLNYNYDKQQEAFTFSWTHLSTTQTGQNYLTWTQLSPLLDKVAAIGNGTRADGQPKPELRNHDPLGFETGLTVVPGDLLEITPSYLIEEERDFNIPRSERSHLSFCTQLQPSFYRDVCRRSCTPHGGGCDVDCHKEYVEARCLASEDHWTDRTLYSPSAPRFSKVDQPIGQMKQIFDGLKLRFVWRNPKDGKQRELTCPLNLFSRQGDGKSLIVRLENRGDSCPVFDLDPTIQPMLYLVNDIDFAQNYLEGQEVKTWDGRTSELPIAKIFHPVIQFAGTVAIRGYSFAGAFSQGRKIP